MTQNRAAISYTRFSTPEQAKGDSLRRQLEATEAYCAQRGLVLDKSLSFRDAGVSGFTGANRESGSLRDFLDAVRAGTITPGSHLIIESLDRLSRERPFEALALFQEIVRANITIHTMMDRQEYSLASIEHNPMQLMMSFSTMIRAHEESAHKSLRLAASWEQKRKHINDEKMTARTRAWLRVSPDRKTFITIPDRVAVVQRVYAESADGIGKRKIAERLNREGIKPFGRGDGWHHSYIQKLLDDEAVIGRFQPCRMQKGRRVPVGEPVIDYYPPIIDAATFVRAQEARARRTNEVAAGRKGLTYSNLLSGLAVCADCMGSMTFRDKGPPPKGGRYLACDNAARGRGCVNRTHFRYDLLEAALIENIGEFDFSEVIAARPVEVEHLEENIARLQLLIDESLRKQALFIQAFEDGAPPLVKDRIKELQAEIDLANRAIAAARAKLNTYQYVDAPPEQAEIARRLYAQLALASAEERYRLRAKIAQALRSFVDFINFDGEQRTVDVVILAGLRVYRFIDGKLQGHANFLHQLDKLGGVASETFTFGDPARQRTLERLQATSVGRRLSDLPFSDPIVSSPS
jgi:DNA invertase Pin-like site-specific DNA recombinase